MSSYGKGQDHYGYDTAATRPDQVSTYAGYAQPSFASQYTDAQARLPHEPSSAEMSFIPTSTYESRAAGGSQAQSSFIDARSRSLAAADPRITNPVKPSHGTFRTHVFVHIRAKHDISLDSPHLYFMFGNKKCPAALERAGQEGEYYNYAVHCEAPIFSETGEIDPTMTLQLRIEDKFNNLITRENAGKFTFTDMDPYLAYSTSPEISRKRKYSTDFDESQGYSDTNAAKRSNSIRVQAKPRSASGTYSAASVSPLPLQPSLPGTYGYPSGYDLSKQHHASYTPQLSQKSLYAVPSGISIPQTDMKPPGLSPNLSYQYPPLSHTGRSPASMPATPARVPVMPSAAASVAPVLVRSTTLSQGAGGSSSGQPFNPYAMYPTKAVLKIDGDLNSMSEGWTQEEYEAKRRLVQFERSQSGSTITTSFAPVTPEARPARSICVSCILWAEKEECFITSVDTIYLLEQLVNVRFTVEEKNRIRRNLEGFRPLTVSKAKSDSEDFFKIIMGFPNPKPRNIEKDVKVFPWKILSHALKKIISKYSASYSSTAGAGSLPHTTSGGYMPVGITQGDVHRNASPRSAASSAASTAYTPSLTSTSLSPNMKASAGFEGSAGQGMAVPQRGPTGHGMTQWGPGAHHQVPQYSAGLSSAGRGSWDYGAYLNPDPATTMTTAAQSMQMQRPDVTPDMSQMPGDNTYQHQQYGQRTTRV